MKPSIVAKLEALQERHEEVQALLGDAGVIADQDRFRALSREYAQLTDVSHCFLAWRQVQDDLTTAEMLLDDPEMRDMAQEELKEARGRWPSWSSSCRSCCCPKILTMSATVSLRCAPVPAAMRPRCLPAIFPDVQPLR